MQRYQDKNLLFTYNGNIEVWDGETITDTKVKFKQATHQGSISDK